MSRIVLKISYRDDIRRIPLNRDELSFSHLHNLVAESFQLRSTDFFIKYLDEDSDKITVNSDAELREAIEYLSETQRYSRFFVSMKGQEEDICQSLLNSSLQSSTIQFSGINNDRDRYQPNPPYNPHVAMGISNNNLEQNQRPMNNNQLPVSQNQGQYDFNQRQNNQAQEQQQQQNAGQFGQYGNPNPQNQGQQFGGQPGNQGRQFDRNPQNQGQLGSQGKQFEQDPRNQGQQFGSQGQQNNQDLQNQGHNGNQGQFGSQGRQLDQISQNQQNNAQFFQQLPPVEQQQQQQPQPLPDYIQKMPNNQPNADPSHRIRMDKEPLDQQGPSSQKVDDSDKKNIFGAPGEQKVINQRIGAYGVENVVPILKITETKPCSAIRVTAMVDNQFTVEIGIKNDGNVDLPSDLVVQDSKSNCHANVPALKVGQSHTIRFMDKVPENPATYKYLYEIIRQSTNERLISFADVTLIVEPQPVKEEKQSQEVDKTGLSPDEIDNLVQMGFSEAQAVNALREHGFEKALEVLLDSSFN